ncbi:MAG: SIMPL domain-containing protein [Bacteroidaceae bacterium]|nr:SIMPL domain-containing protein [Bacteroidaceae bacterium]
MMKSFPLCAIALLSMVASLFVPASLSAQNNLPAVPYIEVRASATRKVAPDEIYLRITIKESDYKGKKSLQDVQKTMVRVLEKEGIDVEENLTVLSMGSSVKLKAFSSKVKSLTEAVYILQLSDVATMQNVISALEAQEISNIVLAETKYSRRDALENELGVEAIKKAKQRAVELVAAIGQEVGKAIYVNSWGMNEVVSPRNYKAMAARGVVVEEAAVDAAAPVLSIAENEYSVDVNVRFEIK